MELSDEYADLISALVDKLQKTGLLITHVNGHADYPQPTWVQQTDEWALPDVIAEDRSRGLIILGDVITTDSWDTARANKNLEILQTCAHTVYVMVPDTLINLARARQRRETWRNVHYISPSSRK